MTKWPDPVKTFDVCNYSNGDEYIVTDHGPNVWTTCALCGGEAAALPTMRSADVLCGPCMLHKYKLWPGEAMAEANTLYAKELSVRTGGQPDRLRSIK